MMANNHNCVTDDEVYEYLIRQEEESEKKKKAISKKQSETEKKRQKALKVAYRKCDNNDKKMNATDYRVLLKELLIKGDVLPKKVAGLKAMFNRPRYQELMEVTECKGYVSDDESTSTCDSDISTGTRTGDVIEERINGEVDLTEQDCV